MKEYILKTPEELKAFAAKLAKSAKAGDIFALTGNLGAGKTTFAQGFITALVSKPQPVTSPTFNIIQQYPAKDFTIWHVDLYRLKSPSELDHLGLEDAFNDSVCLIEWPQIAEGFLPARTIHINIQEKDDGTRQLSIQN